MAISEPVMTLETHKLMPGDIYSHPAMGEAFLQPREVCFR
jgi:hypothetical protein